MKRERAARPSLLICGFTIVWMACPSMSWAQNDTSDTHAFSPRLFGEARLRAQHVDRSDGLRDGTALTGRVSGGIELDLSSQSRPLGPITLLGEIEGVVAFVDNFEDGRGKNPERPFIPDVEGIELNRLQLTFEPASGTRLTLGRQRIALDDWRFVGEFPFRQNRQSFDAARLEIRALGPGTLDVGWFGRALRPLGGDNPAGRFKGDSLFANYSLPTPVGALTAFHYRFDLRTDLPEPARNHFDQTVTGARLFGRHFWDNGWGVGWEASYARQAGFRDNPQDFSTDYYLAQASVDYRKTSVALRYEELGSDNGVGFQTPLASLHRFQGFADQFLMTPPDGVRDLSVGLTQDVGQVGPFKGVRFLARHHRFSAATDGRDYGSEWDAAISARLGGTRIGLDVADYRADTFRSDTRTIYLSTTWDF